jgi:hypothetical protein
LPGVTGFIGQKGRVQPAALLAKGCLLNAENEDSLLFMSPSFRVALFS